MHELRGKRADIPESLNHHAATLFIHAELSQSFVAANYDAATSGLASPGRTPEFDGLAGDYGRGGFADVHGIGVHDPGHSLLTAADVRCGNVAFGAEPIGKFGSVASRETFQFASRELARITDDAALGAAERDIHNRTLPGHPRGERADFIERNIRIKSDAAFSGAANGGVEDAIAGENFELAIVHADGYVKRDFLFGVFQIAVKALFETEFLRGNFETRFGILVDIHFFGYGGLRHAELSFEARRQ